MSRPFTRNEGAEQIDGAFELSGSHYLAECRWRAKPANGRELDGFYGQVDRAGDQAMGVFLSINGWADNVPKLLKQNRRKAIILIDGDDFKTVLSGIMPLEEMLRAKLQALNQQSEPFVSVQDILKMKV
jgi:hypothetical protein